jgi:hypothetical protein
LQLLFGGVQYDPPENGCSLESTFFYKRKPFEHEKEFRVVVLHVDTERPGLYVEINEIEQFIKEVCVAPTAPDWFRELTRRVTADYGFYWDVKTSDLDAIPLSDPHV